MSSELIVNLSTSPPRSYSDIGTRVECVGLRSARSGVWVRMCFLAVPSFFLWFAVHVLV